MFSNARSSVDKTGQNTKDPYFKDTILLLHADSTNGAGNITYTDSSSYGTPITRGAGTNAQGAFNPYLNEWGMSFNGTGDYATVPNINFSTNKFTIEGWFYPTTNAANTNYWGTDNGGGSLPKLLLYIDSLSRLLVDCGSYGVPLSPDFATYVKLYNWNHIALVRKGTGTNQLMIYINGVNAMVGTLASDISGITATFNVGYIGEAFGTPFAGFISNFRVVNGSAVYPNDFTPSTSALTIYSSGTTKLLTAQSSTIVDNSSSPVTLTATGSVTTSNSVIPFSNTYSYHFNTTYLTTSSFSFTSTINFTIEFWIYPEVINNSDYIISTSAGSGINYLNGTLAWFGNGGAITIPITGATNNAYTWSHIAITRDTLYAIDCFLNGVKVNSGYDATDYTGATTWIIGGRGGPTWQGYISNLRMVSGAVVYGVNVPTSNLTAITNTALLLNSNSWIDSSSLNKQVTPSGTPWIVPYSPFAPSTTYNPAAHSGSLYSSIAADYVGTISNAMAGSSNNLELGGNDFTIEFWGYPLVSTGSAQYFFGNYSADTNQKGLRIGFINTTGASVLVNNGATAITYQISTRAVWMNSWNHVAVTRRSNIMRVYINGILISTVSDTNSYNIPILTVGNQVAARTTLLLGYTCDVRVVRGLSVYNANFTPPKNMISADLGTTSRTYYAASITTASSQYLTWNDTVTPLITTDGFCIEFWINFSATPAGTAAILGDLSLVTGMIVKISQTTISISSSTAYTLTTPAQYNFVANAWYHIAIIGNTNTFVAVNGSVYDFGYRGGGSTAASGTGYWTFIGQFGGGTATTGYSFIARDFRITKGNPVYSTSGFTPPTAPLTNVVPGGTVVILAFAMDPGNNSLYNNAIGSLVNQGNFTFTQISSLYYSPYKETANTVCMLNFNKAGVYDATGKNVLAVGVTATTPPTVSTAQFKFGGSSVGPFVNTFYRIPNSPLWHFGNAGFAMEFWIYPTNVTTLQTIFSKKAATTGFGPVQVNLTATGVISVLLSTSGTATTQTLTGTRALTINTWSFVSIHQFVFINTASIIYLSINGVSDTSLIKSNGTNLILNTADVAIGNNSIASSSQPFLGYLDDFRVTRGTGPNQTGVRGYTGTFNLTVPTTAFPNQ